MPEAGRVVTGAAKGGRLLAPGAGTRPMSDRVKQALFATLEAELGGWDGPFLDLFAGSGSGGIEALSRGAPSAVFVERDVKAARVIQENLRRLALHHGDVRVVRADVERFLERQADQEGGPFAAALADPPYGDASLASALTRLGDPDRAWLVDGAIVVAKHFWRDRLPAASGSLRLLRERRFGETQLTFYRATTELVPAGAVGDASTSPEADQ